MRNVGYFVFSNLLFESAVMKASIMTLSSDTCKRLNFHLVLVVVFVISVIFLQFLRAPVLSIKPFLGTLFDGNFDIKDRGIRGVRRLGSLAVERR